MCCHRAYDPVCCVQTDERAMTRQEIRLALLDSFWGIERGLNASSETRAEINELITQLEAVTPIPEPTEVPFHLR